MSVYEALVKICDTAAELPSGATEGVLAYCKDDDFLRVRNGTAWVSAPRSIIKVTSETRTNDSTMTADDELAIPLLALVWYQFDLYVQFNTQATPDFKCDIGYSGSPTTYREWATYIVPGSTTPVATTPHSSIGTDTVIAGGSAGEAYVEIHGAILTATAGTLSFRWAQNTSDAGNTIVRSGSTLVLRRG